MVESGSHDMPEQHRQFAREYIKDFNASRAAIVAGYSKKTAPQQASRLLKNVKVKNYLAELIQKRAEKTETDSEYVLLNARKGFETLPTEIMDDDWIVKPLSEWPKHCLVWITPAELKKLYEKQESGEMVHIGDLQKLRWPDKTKLLELIGKHVDVKAFQDNVNHDHKFDNDQIKTLRDIVRGAKHKEVKSGPSS